MQILNNYLLLLKTSSAFSNPKNLGNFARCYSKKKLDGSQQWQDGYPNPERIKEDIEKQEAFVLTEEETIFGYCAIMINNEPAYNDIEGKWLTNGDFVVLHRLAFDEKYLGKGLAKKIITLVEDFASQKNIMSVKVDTNFDNPFSIFLKLWDIPTVTKFILEVVPGKLLKKC